MRMLFLILFIVATPARAVDTSALIDQLTDSGDPGPLYEALDMPALARAADAEAGVAEALEDLRGNLQGGRLGDVGLADNAAGQTLRLSFANGGLNYLTLDRDESGRLAGWYDFALGVHLHELVAALVALDPVRASALLEQLNEAPLKALALLPEGERGRVLSRLVLAACAGQPCYGEVLLAMRPLEPERAALWRFEQAVLEGRSPTEALAALQDNLGADPGLAWLRVAETIRQGDCETALPSAEKAVRRWPSYRPLYSPAAQCAVELKQYERATRWFRALEERFGIRIDWQALERQPKFSGYLSSESFRDWRSAGG